MESDFLQATMLTYPKSDAIQHAGPYTIALKNHDRRTLDALWVFGAIRTESMEIRHSKLSMENWGFDKSKFFVTSVCFPLKFSIFCQKSVSENQNVLKKWI